MPKKGATLSDIAEKENPQKPKRKYVYHSEESKARQLAGLRKGTPEGVTYARESAQSYRDSLASHVRQIGNEEIEVRGKEGEIVKWKRIDAVVRRIYSDALNGKTAAAEIIFERGWGKVAAPVQIDLKSEFTTVIKNSGLTWQEIMADPILASIAQSAGVDVIEGEVRTVPQIEGPK